MRDWLLLFRRAAFIVYLRLTSKRRQRRIARLEARLSGSLAELAPTWSNLLYEMQGVVQGVFPGSVRDVRAELNKANLFYSGAVFDVMDRAAKVDWIEEETA